MAFGERLKKLRLREGYTQKDLADKLNVTFQTISKWENNTNEPDFSTLKEISKIFSCPIEYLFSDDEEENETQLVSETNEEEIEQEPSKKVISTCYYCKNDIYEGDLSHQIEEKTGSGKKEIITICDSCFKLEEEKNRKKVEEIEKTLKEPIPTYKESTISKRDDSKALKLGIGLGILSLILAIIFYIINFNLFGVTGTIVGPIVTGYVVMATAYCLASSSFIGDTFLAIASWSIKFPGIIFTFDLDGIIFLIVMKLLFLILGIFISIFVFLLAFFISSILSVFAFIPLIIHNGK